MDFIHVGIYSREDGYGELLSMKLAQYYPRFHFTLLGEEQLKHSGLRKQFDLILVDGLKEPLKGKYVGLVSSPNQVVMDEDLLEFKLLKYGNVREMAQHLLFLYSSLTNAPRLALQNRRSQSLVFLSNRGGTGTTTIALGMAQCFARYLRKKVLYLSLENFLHCSIEKGQRGLEEFIYYFLEGSPKATQLEAYQEKGLYEFWTFRNRKGLNPLLDLGERDLVAMMDFLVKSGSYDYLFLDIGNHSTYWTESILNRAYRIVSVYDRRITLEDVNQTMGYLESMCGNQLLQQLQLVANRCGLGDLPDCGERIPILWIEEAEYELPLSSFEIPLDGMFGADLKKLMKELT
jgi:hypothetical protein